MSTDLAKRAYETYVRTMGGEMPPYENLPDSIKQAWMNVVDSVKEGMEQ